MNVKTKVSNVLIGICCLALSGTMLSVSENVYADEIVGTVSVADTAIAVPTIVVDENGVLLDVNRDVERIHLDNTIKAINEKVFAGCTNLKEVTMTNSVEFIGDNAFDACPNLEKVVLSGRVVADNIFGNMHDGLDYKGFTLSFATDGLSEEKENTLMFSCSSEQIKSVDIPDGYYALDLDLSGCLNLESVSMTNSVHHIREGAFNACPNLAKVILSGHAPCENLFGGMYDDFDYKGVNIAFAEDGLNKSAKGEDENNLLIAEIHSEQIKSVDIPDGYYALDLDLSGCLNLESVSMTNSVHHIRESAFNACPSLTKVILSGHAPCENLFGGMYDDFDYKGVNIAFAEDGLNKSAKGEDENNLLIAEIHSEQIKSVDIPDGYYVLDLDLSGCLNLESVSMTNSVHHIREGAFNACTNIKTVKISSEIVDFVTKENVFASSENFVKISYDGMISGDANNDGVVSVADAVCLMKILTVQNTEYPTMASDINEDGKINIIDLIHFKNMLLS